MSCCQGKVVRIGIVGSAWYVAIKQTVLRNRLKTASWLCVRTPASSDTTASQEEKNSVGSYDTR